MIILKIIIIVVVACFAKSGTARFFPFAATCLAIYFDCKVSLCLSHAKQAGL